MKNTFRIAQALLLIGSAVLVIMWGSSNIAAAAIIFAMNLACNIIISRWSQAHPHPTDTRTPSRRWAIAALTIDAVIVIYIAVMVVMMALGHADHLRHDSFAVPTTLFGMLIAGPAVIYANRRAGFPIGGKPASSTHRHRHVSHP